MRDIVRLLTTGIFVNVLIETEGLLETYFWIAAMETALVAGFPLCCTRFFLIALC